MQKLKRGDRVRVMATVDYDKADDSDRVSIRLDTALDTIRVNAAAVEFRHHEVKVGQFVERRHEGAVDAWMMGKVLAIHGEVAWVVMEHGQFDTWPLTDVEIIEADEDEPAKAEPQRLVPRQVADAAE